MEFHLRKGEGREPRQKSRSHSSIALLGIKHGQKLNEAKEVRGSQVLGGPAGQATGLDLNLLGAGTVWTGFKPGSGVVRLVI